MSDPSGIQAVTDSLCALLRDSMVQDSITVAARPLDRTPDLDPPFVNLFLYRVTEGAHVRNHDLTSLPGMVERGHPPLSVDLHYLMTVAGRDPADDSGAHRVLGAAMLAFHSHPVIPREHRGPGSDPQDALELLRVTLEPVSMGEVSTLWTAATTPYRLSVGYRVTGVLLEPTH